MSKLIYNSENFPEFDPGNYEVKKYDFGEVGGGFTAGNVEFYLPDVGLSVWVSCNDESVTIHSADVIFNEDNSDAYEKSEDYLLYSATFDSDNPDAAGPWCKMIDVALTYTIEKETEYRRKEYTFPLPVAWLPESIKEQVNPKYLDWLQGHNKKINIGKNGVIAADKEFVGDVKNVDISDDKQFPAPEVIPAAKPLIRFIDSQYRELFNIPDGEKIRITYPLDDGREPVERVCKFQGETHFQLEKNGTLHICQFAEMMEKIGARYKPVNQLQNIELVAFTAGVGEDKFYSHNREEGNTCVGSLHGDFGNDGDRYHVGWRELDNGLFNGEIQSELQSVIFALRQDLLKDRDSMITFCQSNPDAKMAVGKTSDDKDYATYGFKLETESRQYFVNCFVQGKDSHFAVFAYADKPASVLEQSHQPQAQTKDRKVSDSPDDKPSVLKEIKESRSAPKTPPKPKPKRNKSTKKNQPEH
ncbi:MAG: hypothetical protein FWF81_12980 [Defluviitaleaceae bacterium]|nr:hypothetical protein [Defluviitaleaceae bacterium]